MRAFQLALDQSVLRCEEHLVRDDTRQAWVALRRFAREKRAERGQRTLRGIISALVDEQVTLSRRGAEVLRSVKRQRSRRLRRQLQRGGGRTAGFGVRVARRNQERLRSPMPNATSSSSAFSWPRSVRHRQMLVGGFASSNGRNDDDGIDGSLTSMSGSMRKELGSGGVDGGFPRSPGVAVPHLSLGLDSDAPGGSTRSSRKGQRGATGVATRGGAPPKLPVRARVSLNS